MNNLTEMISAKIPYVLTYVWFIVLSKIIKSDFFDFEFLKYHGDSDFLIVCIFGGFVCLLAVGMLPATYYWYRDKLSPWTRLGDIPEFCGLSFGIVGLCFIGMMSIVFILGCISVLGLLSEDAFNAVGNWLIVTIH